ncbi:hypothetical protein ICC49_005242 [Salmonella enterica]|nr:hypothetical protein [Salmonella enterica]
MSMICNITADIRTYTAHTAKITYFRTNSTTDGLNVLFLNHRTLNYARKSENLRSYDRHHCYQHYFLLR